MVCGGVSLGVDQIPEGDIYDKLYPFTIRPWNKN